VEDDRMPVDVDAALAADEDTTPGMVLALTTPSRPTPATAPKATPAVRRLRVRNAASRALTLEAWF
jgi:hypothetical protein